MSMVETMAPKESDAEQAAKPESDHERRFLLHDISWQFYEAFLAELVERPGLRLTYDRGNLELRTLSYKHEWLRRRIGLLIQCLAEELNLDFQGYGSTTFKRGDLQRGLESDEGYYIANESRIRGKTEIDLRRDPPPDLAVEVEISRSALNRMVIYAALRIPELWRFDGVHLHVYRLRPDGEYEELTHTPTFPFLPLAEAIDFLRRTYELSESGMLRACREWIRSRLPVWRAGNGAGQ